MKKYQIRMVKKLLGQGWENGEIAKALKIRIKDVDFSMEIVQDLSKFESETLLIDLPIDYLQHLYEQKLVSEGFKINEKNVYEDEKLELYNGEKFKKHPNTNLYVSNYGRIKMGGKIIKQELEKEGYLYIPIPYTSFMYNEAICSIKEYKYHTPSLVFKKIETDKEIEPIKGEHYDSHPYLPIHRNKRGHYFSKDYDNNKYFYKTTIAKNGGQTFFVPIYVYRLVAETWCFNPMPDEYTEVHHIINNGYNNTIFNLLWVTHSQHRIVEKRK
jgi:hypothetical protein